MQDVLILGAEGQVGSALTSHLLSNGHNVEAFDMDSQDNIKPNKQKSGEKIDGVVSSILTLFGWLQEVAQPATGSYLLRMNWVINLLCVIRAKTLSKKSKNI